MTADGALVPNFLFYLATPPLFFADIATGQLTGFGHYGYYMALDFLHSLAG